MQKKIRILGRGGQGGISLSRMLVEAVLMEGKEASAIPAFSFVRRGAPTRASLRIDDKPIREKTQVYDYDCVIVLDPTLYQSIDVYEGLKDDGVIIANDGGNPDSIDLPENYGAFASLDATSVARDKIRVSGMPATNTTMAGAFSKVTNWIGKDSIKKAFENHYSGEMLKRNTEALEEGYRSVEIRN